MSRYLVIKEWRSLYPNPILLNRGSEVIIDNTRKETDPDWKGWVWCRSVEKEGWVPIQLLNIVEEGDLISKAIALEDYSANELNVTMGEFVIGETSLNGWLWCKKEGDEEFGWLPLDVLEITKSEKNNHDL